MDQRVAVGTNRMKVSCQRHSIRSEYCWFFEHWDCFIRVVDKNSFLSPRFNSVFVLENGQLSWFSICSSVKCSLFQWIGIFFWSIERCTFLIQSTKYIVPINFNSNRLRFSLAITESTNWKASNSSIKTILI